MVSFVADISIRRGLANPAFRKQAAAVRLDKQRSAYGTANRSEAVAGGTSIGLRVIPHGVPIPFPSYARF